MKTTINMIPLDQAILTATTRLGVVRPWHLAAGLNASPWHVRGRLRQLVGAEYLVREVVSVDLLDRPTGKVRASQATVYRTTAKGVAVAGRWVVPAYDDLTHSLPAVRVGRTHLAHTLGQADLWSWYARTLGSDGTDGTYELATEREIVSLEMPVKKDQRPTRLHWTVRTAVGVTHPPDLALRAPDGRQWAVELERAQKSVQEYTDVIGAYQASGFGQIWHVLSRTTGKRLVEAAMRCGVQWGASPARGVNVSTDALFRIQGWLPGYVGTGGPETWQPRLHLPATPPAAMAEPAKPPVLDTWRRGRVVDPEAVVLEQDWWAA
jgi:hypothetical protein